jgi:integrase
MQLMAIYKERDTWRAEIYIDGKRTKSKSGFKNKREAKKWHDIQLGLYLYSTFNKENDTVYTNLTFQHLILRFEEIHLPTIRATTAMRYKIDLTYRIKPFFINYKLEMINQCLIEDFKIQILNELSPKSVNNCLGLLKTILKKGVEWDMLKENPAKNVRMQKISDKKYTWWEDRNHITQFLSLAKEDAYYLAYRLALDLGMRLGEIVGLSKSDINLDQCQIHIHRQWSEKEGCYAPTKHGKERFIRFSKSSDLYELLQKAVTEHPKNEIIFVNKNGNRVSARKLSGYYFQNLIRKSAVPKIRFHDLRHTFASWFMIKTANIWDLKSILGHSDIQTTQKYAHLSVHYNLTPNFNWDHDTEL